MLHNPVHQTQTGNSLTDEKPWPYCRDLQDNCLQMERLWCHNSRWHRRCCCQTPRSTRCCWCCTSRDHWNVLYVNLNELILLWSLNKPPLWLHPPNINRQFIDGWKTMECCKRVPGYAFTDGTPLVPYTPATMIVLLPDNQVHSVLLMLYIHKSFKRPTCIIIQDCRLLNIPGVVDVA